jgi:hypothetical protein
MLILVGILVAGVVTLGPNITSIIADLKNITNGIAQTDIVKVFQEDVVGSLISMAESLHVIEHKQFYPNSTMPSMTF